MPLDLNKARFAAHNAEPDGVVLVTRRWLEQAIQEIGCARDHGRDTGQAEAALDYTPSLSQQFRGERRTTMSGKSL